MYSAPLTDDNILILLAEVAKRDNEAFKILLEIQDAKEWVDSDVALSKAHNYLRHDRY